MQRLVDFLLVTGVLLAIGFVPAALLRVARSWLAHLGTGWLGWQLGVWLGYVLGITDPLVLPVRSQEIPILLALAGSAIVTLLVRLVSGRVRRRD